MVLQGADRCRCNSTIDRVIDHMLDSDPVAKVCKLVTGEQMEADDTRGQIGLAFLLSSFTHIPISLVPLCRKLGKFLFFLLSIFFLSSFNPPARSKCYFF